jgi:hypothetical protein
MIIGAHSIIRSTNPEADCAFLRDVLKLTHVDDGGYLIFGLPLFGLPPAEVSVHASDKNDGHQLYLLCDNVKAFVAEMEQHRVHCNPLQDEGWGVLTELTLPGGGKLSVYEPRHARPKATSAKAAPATNARRSSANPAAGKRGRSSPQRTRRKVR